MLAHILKTCPAARPALEPATREGEWLGAGPIRPGFRTLYQDGLYKVGNAAGEAHPVVAEGISIALQSGWLAAGAIPEFKPELSMAQFDAAGREYSKRWRRLLASRIRAAAVFAHLAMRPNAARVATVFLSCFPSILTWCAQWSGKIHSPESVFPIPQPEACVTS